MTTTPLPVHQALAAVMADVEGVAKKDRNTQQGFSFRGIDAVMNAVGPALRKHGVTVRPVDVRKEYDTVEVGQKRTPMTRVRLQVTYSILGPAGDELFTTVPGEAFDSGDKATAKAMSVAFRTCLLQTLCLPTDEPDPDSESYERAPAEQAEKVPPPALDDLWAHLDNIAGASGKSRRDVTSKWMTAGGWSDYDAVPYEELARHVKSVERYLAASG